MMYVLGITVQRHALNIDYDLRDADQVLAFYKIWEQDKAKYVHTLPEFMMMESWVGVTWMIRLVHDPFMFHQV